MHSKDVAHHLVLFNGKLPVQTFQFFAFSFPRHQLLFTTREEDWDLVKAKGTCYLNSRLKEFRELLSDSPSLEELCKVCVRSVTMLYQGFYLLKSEPAGELLTDVLSFF